jgi:chromosome segregation ATPase
MMKENRIQDLEAANNDISNLLENIKTKARQDLDELKQLKDQVKKLNIQKQELNESLIVHLESCKKLEAEMKDYESLSITYQTKNDLAEKTVKTLEVENLELKSELKVYQFKEASNLEAQESQSNLISSLKQENSNLLVRLEEAERLVESYQSYREKAEECEQRIEELQFELESSQEINKKLIGRLSAIEPVDTQEQDQGSKTLFGEMEDKRQELINVYQELETKHAQSIHRQQRMKNHIARLSQLSSLDKSEEKILMLEQALAQCESEKMELEDRLDKVRRQNSIMMPADWEGSLDLADGDDSSEKYRIMEIQLQSLIEECEGLKKQNKTLRLVKTSETGKLHEALLNLNEKNKELESIQRAFAKLKFDFDELKTESQQSGKQDAMPKIEKKKPVTPGISPMRASQKIITPIITNSSPPPSNKPTVNLEEKSNISKANEAALNGPTQLKSIKNIKIDRTKVQKQECNQQ